MFCSKCGTEINGEAQFCSQCGTRVTMPNLQNQVNTVSDTSAVSVAAEVADNTYKICIGLAAACVVLLLTNWISFPILSSAASIAGSITGSSASYSAEYTIPGLMMVVNNIQQIDGMYSSTHVVTLPLLFLTMAWLCTIAYTIASIVSTVRKKSIFYTCLIGAFGWTLATSLACILMVFIANSMLVSSAGSVGIPSVTYISTTLWVWLAAIVSGCSLAYLLDAQKKQRLKKKKSRN